MMTIEHDPNETPSRPRRRYGWMIAGAVAIALAGGAGLAMATDTVTAGRAAQYVTKAGWGGGFGGPRFERMLREIEATDEQTDRLWDIAGATITEMWPMVRGFHSARDEARALFTAPQIDREAIERLRVERMAAIDAASRTLVGKLVEAAEVLTPEQRAKLVEQIQERRGHRFR
jgi:protein CpxP